MWSRATVAVLAGMAVAGPVLIAPSVAAPPAATGRAAAWGHNDYGQLGNNSTTDTRVPVAVNTSGVLAGKTLTAISAGSWHTCALADGKAYCWGLNGYGRLGNNSTTNSSVPVAVDTTGVLNGKTITGISAGWDHTCAVADGKAYCWGYNEEGELGNNSDTSSPVPVAVNTTGMMAGKTVTAISVGSWHTCAVADGKAFCWGLNGYGQLGNNSTALASPVPVAVDTTGVLAGKTVTAISAGERYTCAVADGKAFCWGLNGYGKLGNNSTAGLSQVPVSVDTTGVLKDKTVTGISAGSSHTCAVAEGRASCWGYNYYGQLGNNSTTPLSRVPVAVDTTGVLAGKTVTAISAGTFHTCAVADGSAYCWGNNGSGQLGINSHADSSEPVAVDTSGVLAGKTFTAISAGLYHTAVLAASAPSAPTSVSGVPADRQITVSWAPPGDDGGSPVLDYTATSVPGGASCTTAGTSCTVTGLVNGTGYTFTVAARNAIGTSTPSAPSAPVTPSAPVSPQVNTPGAVTGVKVKLNKNRTRVKISWRPVGQADSYRVRVSKPGAKKYRAWQTTTNRKFNTKVRPGGKYRVQIAAVGPGGTGPRTTVRFTTK